MLLKASVNRYINSEKTGKGFNAYFKVLSCLNNFVAF